MVSPPSAITVSPEITISPEIARATGWIGPAGPLWAATGQKTEPLLMRLDPASRAKVLMSLLGLVIVGVALVAMIWIGARRLRRIARQRTPATADHEHAWYRKPLVPRDSPSPGDREGL